MKEKKEKNPRSDDVTMSFRINRQHLMYIKKKLLKQSYEEGRSISAGEAIRECLEHCYPMPKDLNLFKDE